MLSKTKHTLLFIDTETTGLTSTDQIMQFAAIYGVFDGKKLHEEGRINQYVNITTPINFWAQRVHGLSKSMVATYKYIDHYIDDFLTPLSNAHCVIGHNIAFDLRMLQQECSRIGKAYDRTTVNTYCTMQDARHLVDLPGRKRLKLSALYEHLFGASFAHAHDAMADIEATKNCFVELAKRGEIIMREGKLSPNTPELPPKGLLKKLQKAQKIS